MIIGCRYPQILKLHCILFHNYIIPSNDSKNIIRSISQNFLLLPSMEPNRPSLNRPRAHFSPARGTRITILILPARACACGRTHLLIQKVVDLQLQQVRDTRCSVDPHHKQQPVPETLLFPQQVFDLSGLFFGRELVPQSS